MKNTTTTTPEGRSFERPVGLIATFAQWLFVTGAGILLWLLGLFTLDVPGGLPPWRHMAGAALLVCAVHLWRKVVLPNTEAKGPRSGPA